ncbi:hypothetical protein ACFQY7_30420 [Actinomadura luteofluorescens]
MTPRRPARRALPQVSLPQLALPHLSLPQLAKARARPSPAESATGV